MLLCDSCWCAHIVAWLSNSDSTFLIFRSFYNVLIYYPLQCMGEYFNVFHHLGQTETMRDVYKYYQKTLKVMAYKQGLSTFQFKRRHPYHLFPANWYESVCNQCPQKWFGKLWWAMRRENMEQLESCKGSEEPGAQSYHQKSCNIGFNWPFYNDYKCCDMIELSEWTNVFCLKRMSIWKSQLKRRARVA